MKRELRADGSCNAPHAAFSPLKAEQPGVMAELFLPSLAALDELTPSEFLHVFTAMLDSRATHASVCVCSLLLNLQHDRGLLEALTLSF